MITRAQLISPAYLAQQQVLHARPEGYGGKGQKWAAGVCTIAKELGATSILDYGCGQGALKKALQTLAPPVYRIDEYDPAIPGKDGMPVFADLVVCTDVLEHVEPERLPTVLAHLKLLARKAVFVVIATRPSNKTLPDGRNAHLIQEDGAWWLTRMLEAGFTITAGPPSPLLKPSREWVALLRLGPC